MEKTVIEKKINEIKDKIVREYKPEKIILFGSWAWGEPHADSDFDLLVIKNSNSTQPRVERERELDAILSPRDVALDILVYSSLELEDGINNDRNLFLEDIIRNGTVLYAKADSDIVLIYPPAQLVA